jgi:AbiU2
LASLGPASVMATPEEIFEKELEVFRTEAEAGTQFFYAYLTVHAVAGDDSSVHRVLNTAPLFWNTALGALQTATFIALGRGFDQNSPHNIDRVLGTAQRHPEIFDKAALAKRKQGSSKVRPDWLDEYLEGAHVPKPADFRRLRTYVKEKRKIYDRSYRDLRHKVYAHKELSERAAVEALFARTNIRELERLFAFLNSFHETMWQLFFNGRKPVLRPRRYSLKRMRDLPSPAESRKDVQERIVQEAEAFLLAAARVAQPSVRPDRSTAPLRAAAARPIN